MSIKSIRRFCEYKALAFIRQVDDISRSEFPHEESRAALTKVRSVVANLLDRLTSLPDDFSVSIQRAMCVEVSRQISQLHLHLGFILRSTNVRNSFEFFDPLSRLSKRLLGNEAQLILSSEWEWSPVTLPMNIPQLPEFVLIGLPAFESENALLIPLAGHEIGHSVWLQKKVREALLSHVAKATYDQFMQKWEKYISLPNSQGGRPKDRKEFLENVFSYSEFSESLRLAVSQCTEVFCDFVGLRLFGESFLRAFEYFLAPEQTMRPDYTYPSEKQRVEYMVAASKNLEVPLTSDHGDYFVGDSAVGDQTQVFLGEIADQVTKQVVDSLADKVKEIANKAGIPSLNATDLEPLVLALKRGVPTHGLLGLHAIIGAAWLAHDDLNWRADTEPQKRLRQLSEVVFKSIEVSEYCTKLSESN